MDKLSGKAGFVYNGGEINLQDIPISAFYSHMELEYDTSKKSKLFSRINGTGSFSSDSDVISQFQSALGKGALESGLELLFADNGSLSLMEDNLDSGDFITDDPGLLTYEVGYSQKFKSIPLKTEIIVGAGNSGDLIDIGFIDSFLGFEVDIKNKIDITEDISMNMDFSYLIPGEVLDSEDQFKIECSVKYEF